MGCADPIKAILILAAGSVALMAQDTRTVVEPKIPPACVALQSQLPATLSEADETKTDTARIQGALDKCGKGKAVVLTGGAFLSGPLQLRAGVTLAVDAGTTLHASRNARDYDVTPGACGTVTKVGRGCKPLIAGVLVDDAGVMGDGTIDGRGAMKILGRKDSWWDLAQEAKVKNLNQSCPRIMQISRCNNFTLYKITLKNSPQFHVAYSGGNGFTAWGVKIDTPKAGRNTDGIDPGNSTNVTITHCYINAGDDNVAIKAGTGAPTGNMTISHNHFYGGHGMSIGSETDGGASNILVTDLSIDGADNGLRIKSNSSRGGLVKNVVYEDVCIRNVKNPIYMDSNYSFRGEATDRPPHFADIVLRNVAVSTPGKLTLQGYDATHRLGIAFDGVQVPAETKVVAAQADITLGPGGSNIVATGEAVTVTGTPSTANPNACGAKFVAFPR